MTSAARSAPRVAPSKPRSRTSGGSRRLLGTLLGGFLVIVSGTAMVAAVTALGCALAASLSTRSGIRLATLASPPPGLPALPWSATPATEPPLAAAEPSSWQEARAIPAWMRQPLGALVLVMRDPVIAADDRLVTGSLGVAAPKLPHDDELGPRPAPRHGPQMPLPRARPRLAALTPADVKPEQDDRLRRTAIYDISARVVYLPNGERLEAHSGLGRLMDDPRSMRERNRGVTPPNTYDLKLRESLFHGVQALRMTPANEDAMFGRDGILAHSYMLGPSGQSNGCVSFKDYPKFLRAYLRGEVDRLVVVPHLARPPAFAARASVRSADNMRSGDNVF